MSNRCHCNPCHPKPKTDGHGGYGTKKQRQEYLNKKAAIAAAVWGGFRR